MAAMKRKFKQLPSTLTIQTISTKQTPSSNLKQ